MQAKVATVPNKPKPGLLDGVSLTTLAALVKSRLPAGAMSPPTGSPRRLGVTTRTLCRWDAARIGPPKIKVGKLVLFDLAKLPDWLATRETEPVRASGRRR